MVADRELAVPGFAPAQGTAAFDLLGVFVPGVAGSEPGEAVMNVRQPLAGQHRVAIDDVEVEVRLGGVARVAEEMGTPGAAIGIREQLIKAGFQDRDFEDLEMEVKVDLYRIQEIQLEVTGQSDLAEVSL